MEHRVTSGIPDPGQEGQPVHSMIGEEEGGNCKKTGVSWHWQTMAWGWLMHKGGSAPATAVQFMLGRIWLRCWESFLTHWGFCNLCFSWWLCKSFRHPIEYFHLCNPDLSQALCWWQDLVPQGRETPQTEIVHLYLSQRHWGVIPLCTRACSTARILVQCLVSTFPLAWVEVEKKNHNNLLAWLSKWKGNLPSRVLAARPHCFSEGNSLWRNTLQPRP